MFEFVTSLMTGHSTNSPQLSIVVPVRNERRLLPQLLRQIPCKKEFELIVVDGQSTDGSQEYLNSQKQVRLISSKPGRAVQQNRGAQDAKGSYLLFLHVDSQLPIQAWDALSLTMRQGVAAACFRLAFDASHPLLKIAAYGSRWSHLLFRGGDQGLLVRKELFHQLKGFDERYTVCEDLELIRKLQRNSGLQILPATLTTSARRFLKQGVTRTLFHFRIVHFLHWCHVKPKYLSSYYQRWVG